MHDIFQQAHPVDTNYYIVRATSNVDDSVIAVHLPSEFGIQASFSQDGLAIALDCVFENKNWASHVVLTPRLSEFVFEAGDVPSYLSVGCEDTSHSEARTIVRTTGSSGSAWAAPAEEL